MSENTPFEISKTPNNELQLQPILDANTIDHVAKATDSDPNVPNNAKDELANITKIDKFFDSQRHFIQTVAETGAVSGEVIEEQLEELDVALGAMRGLSKVNDQADEGVESSKDRTDQITQTVDYLIARIENQEDISKKNLKEIENLGNLADVLWERSLHDPTFAEMYNRTGTKMRIVELMQNTERSHMGITLRYIDYRYFKEINKIIQHPRADTILEKVGQQLRGGDIFGCEGGDEFISANITPQQEEAHSPLADGLAYAGRFLTAQLDSLKQFKDEISPKKYARLQEIIGAKIGILQITGDEIAECKSDTAKLAELYTRKRIQADALSTSIAENIRSTIITAEDDTEKKPDPSQIAIVYNQQRTIKNMNGVTATETQLVCTIATVNSVPDVDTQPFEQLVTILNPERILGYDEEHFEAEFKTRTDDAGQDLHPIAIDADLRDE